MPDEVHQKNEQRCYIAYLLRLWRTDLHANNAWHASLECPSTGKLRGFADLHSLFAFLSEECEQDEVKPTPLDPDVLTATPLGLPGWNSFLQEDL